MANNIVDVMRETVHTVTPETTLREAAELMRAQDVGDVVVTESGHLRGILTDRDIVVRCIAVGGDPGTVQVSDICSSEIVTVPRQSSLKDAVHAMRTGTIRRLPVVEGDEVVGVISMGDLAMAIDDRSALADISAAAPNR